MTDKEKMRQKFEACMHRGDTYTERDFQMWCAGHAQGFVEGVAARSFLPEGGNQAPSLPRERVTHQLTNRKADDIHGRDGYEFTGYVLTHPKYGFCIVNMSAVRWMTYYDFWSVMYGKRTAEAWADAGLLPNKDKSEDGISKPADAGVSNSEKDQLHD